MLQGIMYNNYFMKNNHLGNSTNITLKNNLNLLGMMYINFNWSKFNMKMHNLSIDLNLWDTIQMGMKLLVNYIYHCLVYNLNYSLSNLLMKSTNYILKLHITNINLIQDQYINYFDNLQHIINHYSIHHLSISYN